MNYIEYGKENSDVIVLLHGGGLSWWNYKEAAERLQMDYHVIIPIIDGHAGCDKPFTTIENNASEISKNQRIIAGNAQFTGIAAGRGVGFTTGLLLLREGLGMRETPIRPHSWH